MINFTNWEKKEFTQIQMHKILIEKDYNFCTPDKTINWTALGETAIQEGYRWDYQKGVWYIMEPQVDLNKVYVLNIINGGILRVSVARFDLVQLVSETFNIIKKYFVEQYFIDTVKMTDKFEFVTDDDGYAEIVCVDPTGKEETEYSVWDYPFNAERDLQKELSSFLDQLNANPKSGQIKNKFYSLEIVEDGFVRHTFRKGDLLELANVTFNSVRGWLKAHKFNVSTNRFFMDGVQVRIICEDKDDLSIKPEIIWSFNLDGTKDLQEEIQKYFYPKNTETSIRLLNKYYVLSIVDEGVLRLQVGRKNLLDLLNITFETVKEYFELWGYNTDSNKFYTEDGYFTITCFDTELEIEPIHVLQYNFDGEEDLKQVLQEKILKEQEVQQKNINMD